MTDTVVKCAECSGAIYLCDQGHPHDLHWHHSEGPANPHAAVPPQPPESPARKAAERITDIITLFYGRMPKQRKERFREVIAEEYAAQTAELERLRAELATAKEMGHTLVSAGPSGGVECHRCQMLWPSMEAVFNTGPCGTGKLHETISALRVELNDWMGRKALLEDENRRLRAAQSAAQPVDQEMRRKLFRLLIDFRNSGVTAQETMRHILALVQPKQIDGDPCRCCGIPNARGLCPICIAQGCQMKTPIRDTVTAPK